MDGLIERANSRKDLMAASKNSKLNLMKKEERKKNKNWIEEREKTTED